MEQTTARLRKTFHYPTEGDSDDDLPEALDEEEQENLIRTLHEENLARNTQYTYLLLALPLVTAVPYVPRLFSPRTALFALLSITSLLSTAYMVYILPPGVTSIAFLDRYNNLSSASKTAPRRRQVLRQYGLGDDGPVATYLPYLNIGLGIVLIGLASAVGRKASFWTGFGWLPCGVQAVVLLAKWIMGGVDPEGELGSLRYGFKGA